MKRKKYKFFLVFTVLSALFPIGFMIVISSYLNRYGIEMTGSEWTQTSTPLLFNLAVLPKFIGPVIFLFVFLYFLKKWLDYRKEKEQEYDEKVVKPAINQIIPGAQFIREKSMDATGLYRCGLVPSFDMDKEHGIIHYQREGRAYSFSNVDLYHVRENSKGHTENISIYRGQAYTAHYRTGISGAVRIFATKMTPVIRKETTAGYLARQKTEMKIETESILFNDNFDVYVTDEQSAFFVLSPYVMEQLLEMKNRFGQVGVYVDGDDMIITLKTGRILFQKRLYSPEQELRYIEEVKKEAGEMLGMADLLEDTINGNIRNNFTNL
ncbi:MAG: DUF3137 domain-containing protein [Clostridiales bacterium]|nr:DUF3137 domain-containing protein [Clostridiales bacterium]